MLTPPSIDPSDATQLANWDGATGAFWTENAERFDRGVAAYHGLFLEISAGGFPTEPC